MNDLARRLPARPLQKALRHKKRANDLSWEELAARLGICSRTVFRLLKAQDIHYLVADRVACRLGFHPSNLWPKEWS